MNSTYFAHKDITHTRPHRSPKIASKTDEQMANQDDQKDINYFAAMYFADIN